MAKLEALSRQFHEVTGNPVCTFGATTRIRTEELPKKCPRRYAWPNLLCGVPFSLFVKNKFYIRMWYDYAFFALLASAGSLRENFIFQFVRPSAFLSQNCRVYLNYIWYYGTNIALFNDVWVFSSSTPRKCSFITLYYARKTYQNSMKYIKRIG
jgi:hypothetical protein